MGSVSASQVCCSGQSAISAIGSVAPTSAPAKSTPRPLIIALAHLRAAIGNLHLSNDGDGTEKLYWPAINDGFPNYERFWQQVIVPTTKRIENQPDAESRIERREGVVEDLWLITYVNYSLFLNLVGAFEHVSHPLTLSVGNFYTHLASACDLAEEFLLRVHLCVSECSGQAVAFSPLTKAEFFQRLDDWYDKQYEKKYPHSHAKGKTMLVHLDPRDKIKRQDQDWKAYKSFSGPIREYRNKVVHDVQIGTVRVGRINLMPKVEKIKEYASLAAVQEAVKNPEVVKRDFVVREEQMYSHFRAFKELVNALWEKPTEDLARLLYSEQNAILLQKYNLQRG